MTDGTQHRLGRKDNKPRVHITYDVQVGDAIEQKELPFVLGVLADLAGDNAEQPPLRDREFADINRDNFDGVMARQKPRLTFAVDSTLPGHDDERLPVDLTFERMADFEPDNVARRIPALARLLEIRERLKSLLARATGSRVVADFLDEILADADTRAAIGNELDAASPDAGGNHRE